MDGLLVPTMDLQASRLGDSPIITPASHPSLTEHGHGNINGPSLIRAPEWLPNPLGRYYLYFAHHQGTFIRLAVADDLAGPWRVHEPGTLRREQTPFGHHIASPDVHLDEVNHRLVMYYHGCCRQDPSIPWPQYTCVAFSEDGLTWQSRTEPLCNPYLRTWRQDGMFYGISIPGYTWRSRDWTGPFEPGPSLFGFGEHDTLKMRHGAVLRQGETVVLIYSRIGDEPERLVWSTVDVSEPFEQWRGSEPQLLLRPERAWEGVELPVERSVSGARHEPVHQLRDPAVFEDADGAGYLIYSVAGERGLAIARLTVTASRAG